jgi:hypothetical protein
MNEEWASLIALGETPHVDFKAAQEWDGSARAALAVDIVAMANIRDGGALLIGVAERDDGGAFVEGLTTEQAATFDPTKVGGYLANHFQPAVSLTIERATIEEKLIVVIRVQEFDATPIICIKDGPEKPSDGGRSKRYFYGGNVIVRNAAARSEAIRTAEDMHALIRLAVTKTSDQLLADFRRVLEGGAPTVKSAPHEGELDEWAKALESHRSEWSKSFPGHGVLAMAFLPSPLETPLDHSAMRKLPQQSLVQWHGWSLPIQCYEDKFCQVQNRKSAVEASMVLDNYQEVWQLHASGAFMLARLLEYVGNDDDLRLPFEEIILLVVLGIQFARRMYEDLIPDGQVEVAFWVLGAMGQRLGTYDTFMRRVPGDYRAGEDVIESRVPTTVLDLRSAWRGVVHRVVKELFVLFNWNVAPQVIDQRLDEIEGKPRR